jgi:hypothetical protein
MTPTQTTHTCTVRSAVSGLCGKPAVYTWISAVSGETFGECAEHYQGQDFATASSGHQVGDVVTVQRHGKTYRATVSKVGARGAIYAEVVYGNGSRREVRI